MTTLEINENTYVLTLEKGEAQNFLPKGVPSLFALENRESRIALRELLSHLPTNTRTRKVMLEIFGSEKGEMQIFIKIGTASA